MATPDKKAKQAQAHFKQKVLNRAKVKEAARLAEERSRASSSSSLNPNSSRPTFAIRPSTPHIYLNAPIRDIRLVLCDPKTRDAALIWQYRGSHQNPMCGVPIEGTFTYQSMYPASYFKVPLTISPSCLDEALGVPTSTVVFKDFYKAPYGNLIRTAACCLNAEFREEAKRNLEACVRETTPLL
ncbi:MAG: hypothetical protein AABX70_09055 [Nanoarchaeota archaeon]